jgi:hypothetical protein
MKSPSFGHELGRHRPDRGRKHSCRVRQRRAIIPCGLHARGPLDPRPRRGRDVPGRHPFEDIERSTALKRALTERADEQAFQDLRRKHDATVKRIVERDGSRRGRQVDGRRDDLAVSRSLRCRQSAQIFLSTAQGMVRLADGTQRMIRIPDAVLRIRPGRHEACCMRSMRWPTSGTLCSGRSLERPRRDRATGGRTRSSPGRAC